MRSATAQIPWPNLLTVRQVQGFVRLSYRGTLRLIAKRLKPLGAVIERPGGRRYHVLVHDWGVAKLLQPGTHCSACGRVLPNSKVSNEAAATM
jgi:hypothetical protein